MDLEDNDQSIEEMIETLEEDGEKADFQLFEQMIVRGVSEDDLNSLANLMYEKTRDIFTDSAGNKNTVRILKILYTNLTRQIIENIGYSDERYDLVEYMIQVIKKEHPADSKKNSLYRTIVSNFPSDFNHVVMKNFDDDENCNNELYYLISSYNMAYKFSGANKEDIYYGWECIEKYINQNGVEFSTDLLEQMLLDFCDGIADDFKLDNGTMLSLLKKYVDYITKKENFHLFSEQGICDLLQLRNKFLNIFIVSGFYEILENNLHINDIDVEENEKNAREFMKKGRILTEEDFDEFFGYLQNIKLAYRGMLPDDFVNFVVKEMLQDVTILNKKDWKYRGAVDRILENLGMNSAQSIARTKYRTCYFTRDNIELDEPDGTETTKVIYYSPKCDEPIDRIDTIFHENTHLEQDYAIDVAKRYSYIRYMMLKDNILSKEYSDYDEKNYKDLFCEIEAREKSKLKMIRYFLNTLGIANEDIGNVDIKKLIHRHSKENKSYSRTLRKTKGKGKTELNDRFQEVLQKKPELIEKYPILLTEYNKDGSVKTPEQIIRELEGSDNRKRELVIKILKNNKIFRPERLTQDFQFLLNYSSNDKAMERTVAYIVYKVFGDILEQVYEQSYKNLGEMTLEQKLEIEDLVKMARKKIIDEPDSVFAKGATKKDEAGYSLETTLDAFETNILLSDQDLAQTDIQKTIAKIALLIQDDVIKNIDEINELVRNNNFLVDFNNKSIDEIIKISSLYKKLNWIDVYNSAELLDVSDCIKAVEEYRKSVTSFIQGLKDSPRTQNEKVFLVKKLLFTDIGETKPIFPRMRRYEILSSIFDFMTYEEFQKSGLTEILENDLIFANAIPGEVDAHDIFATRYINFLAQNDIEIDIDQDIYLRSFPDEIRTIYKNEYKRMLAEKKGISGQTYNLLRNAFQETTAEERLETKKAIAETGSKSTSEMVQKFSASSIYKNSDEKETP